MFCVTSAAVVVVVVGGSGAGGMSEVAGVLRWLGSEVAGGLRLRGV